MHIRTIPDPGSFCGFIRFWMNAASHFARFRLVGYLEVGSHLPRMTPELSTYLLPIGTEATQRDPSRQYAVREDLFADCLREGLSTLTGICREMTPSLE